VSETETARRVTGPDQNEITTPRIRSTARRLAFWIVVVVVLVVGGIAAIAFTGASPSTARLSATNAHANGARALVQVLRQDGVSVDAPRTLKKALADVTLANGDDAGSTTLVLYDSQSLLTTGRLGELDGVAKNLVLIEPSLAELQAFAPDVSLAGVSPSERPADCDFSPVSRAGAVSGLGRSYRVSSGDDATTCLGSSGSYALVRVLSSSSDGGTVTVLGSTEILTNDSITRAGNAALALGLFGADKHLVWYLPSLSDVPTPVAGSGIPQPPWVGLVVILAALVGLAAVFWRGRRFGPLVIERLPVIVRASETVEGRARLYQRASSRTHALDSLRIGTLDRLGILCGLPKLAGVEEIIGAASRVTGRPLGELRALLLDGIPNDDATLVRMSDDLLTLENDVAAATRPA
jgi:hypothetical protein